MKLKDYEFNKPIETIGELLKYVGKPVYLWYCDPFSNVSKRKIQFAWIKTITDAPFSKEWEDVMGRSIYGHNALCVIKDKKKADYFIEESDFKTETMSNAQSYIRTLTEEEFEMYRKKTMKRRWLMEN